MRILKNEEYDNMRATIKRLLDENLHLKQDNYALKREINFLSENLHLKQDNYALKREINFLKFSAGEWKDLSFPNSEVKEERRYISPELEELNKTVSDFWNSIYKSADSDGANNF